jgi:Domain of unknown function (DUF4189)
MINLGRGYALAVATAGLLMIASIGAAAAAGAFAVGACGAYGYGYDYSNPTDARAAAMKQCSGSTCKIVGIIRRGCAAMAVDAKNPCGPYGWALGSHLGKAENASMRRCTEFGGRDCVVRAWACDEKG